MTQKGITLDLTGKNWTDTSLDGGLSLNEKKALVLTRIADWTFQEVTIPSRKNPRWIYWDSRDYLVRGRIPDVLQDIGVAWRYVVEPMEEDGWRFYRRPFSDLVKWSAYKGLYDGKEEHMACVGPEYLDHEAEAICVAALKATGITDLFEEATP